MKNHPSTPCRAALLALFTAAVSSILPGCGSVSSSSSTPFPAQAAGVVVVRPPETTFVNVDTGVPYDRSPGMAGAVGARMAEALVARLSGMGVSARTGSVAPANGSLLAGRLTVHKGEGGMWNPVTGVFVSTSNRLELELQLATGPAGGPVWTRHVVSREALDPENRALVKLADLALSP